MFEIKLKLRLLIIVVYAQPLQPQRKAVFHYSVLRTLYSVPHGLLLF